jgi:hypothetical protein
MSKHSALLMTAAAAFAAGLLLALTAHPLFSQTPPGSGFAAVPGERGGWDVTGPYGRIQKFMPRRGARAELLVGKPAGPWS